MFALFQIYLFKFIYLCFYINLKRPFKQLYLNKDFKTKI